MGVEVLVGAGLGLLGTGAQIAGQQQADIAQRDQLNAQAQAARENAKLAREEAEQNAKLQKIQSEKVVSGVAPQYAAAGVEGGTVFDVIANSVQNAERDRLNIIHQGELRARSFETQAGAYSRAAGNVGGNLGLIGTGLSGIGGIVSGPIGKGIFSA